MACWVRALWPGIKARIFHHQPGLQIICLYETLKHLADLVLRNMTVLVVVGLDNSKAFSSQEGSMVALVEGVVALCSASD